MITFDLACDRDHRFEGWFRNREDFDDQLGRGLVACPLCGSTRVTKQLSAVAVHVPRRAAPTPAPEASKPPAPASPPAPAGPAGPSGPGAPPVEAKPFFQALARFVETHFEDVGPGFAEEARKIDRGEVEARNIRGSTTPEEEEALREEGVEFLKVAVPKYDA